MRKSDLIFFLSGAAALIDQVAWSRLAGRILGNGSAGVTIILAVFMAGLGGGALIFGRTARKSQSPVRLFFTIQLFVALWTAASPFVMASTPPVDGWALRAGLAALFLLPPTIGMGATFPLMGRLTIRGLEDTARESGAFYGANTLGAAAGALLAPFLLMPNLGLRGTLLCGASFDALAGILALRLLAAPPRVTLESVRRSVPLSRELLVTLLLGFTALGLEVLLTRLLISVTGASVYAFAIVLAVFLFGIGYGSRLVTRRIVPDARSLSRLCLAIAPVTAIGLCLLRLQLGEETLFRTIDNRMHTGIPVSALWLSHALFAALALLGPALCFGAALPLVAARNSERDTSRAPESWLSWTYGYNTVGALCGALLAGFYLLPRFGLAPALGLILVFPLVAGWIAPGGRTRERLIGSVLGLLFFLIALGDVAPSEDDGQRKLVHGSFSTASVSESQFEDGSSTRSLRVDGKVVATSAPVDVRLQRLLGLIPGQLHGEVRSALVIGLGTGMTAGSLLDLPALTELHIFEISSAVRDCAREFADWNGRVLDDPRTTLRLVDGRHALARSQRKFDLITSDPIHPWTRGSSDLYSLEHFQSMAAHLEPGGVASQWLPLYQLSTRDVETIIATWCEAFPHTSAWLTAYDLALVGSSEPLATSEELVAEPLSEAAVVHLAEAGVHSPLELAALQIADDASLRERCRTARPMRDDLPRLEFDAPRSYLSGYSTEILAWSARADFVSRLPAGARPRALEIRGLLEDFLRELPSGLTLAATRYGQRLLALPELPE